MLTESTGYATFAGPPPAEALTLWALQHRPHFKRVRVRLCVLVCVLRGRLPKCSKRKGDLSRNVLLSGKFSVCESAFLCVWKDVHDMYIYFFTLPKIRSQWVKSCVQPNTGDLLSQAVNGGRTPRTGRVQG